MKTVKVTVITVTYNAEKVLDKTIQSIINQTAFEQVEYIIVDGASKDNTLAIIDKYSNYITKWISEPDAGLYHAMNKAIKLATGDYLWFINAGDEIFNNSTLAEILKTIRNADVYYGETEEITLEGQSIGMRRLSVPDKLTWKSFQRGMLVCHQSIIVKRSLADEYNTKYRLAADIDWVIKALKKSQQIVNTQLTLSKFAKGGVSGQNIKKGLLERFHIMSHHYGLITTLCNHIFISFNFFSYYLKNKRI